MTTTLSSIRRGLNRAAGLASQGLLLLLLAPTAMRSETIDFDGLGYVADQRPPAPWTDSYAARGDANHAALFGVVAGQGVGGSQCLSVRYTGLWEGYAVYQLSRALTPEDGAVHFSVKYNPPGNTEYNFTTYGSVFVGDGWMQTDTGSRVGVTFKLEDWQMSYPHKATDFVITSGGGVLGNFAVDPGVNYYQISFDLDAAWTNMTYSVLDPAGVTMSNSSSWKGNSIDKIWLGECGASSYDTGTPTYDDLVVPAVATPPPVVPAAGLVASWSGDGTASDAVSTNHGVLANGVAFAPGRTGQAFSFDGVDDAILIPESAAIDLSRLHNWTITAWIKPTSFDNAQWPTIYSEGRWAMSLGLARSTGQLESWVNNWDSRRSDHGVALNQWSHVALTAAGTNRNFYINGVLAGPASSAEITPDDNGSAIGDVTNRPNSSQFQGLIEEIAIYDTTLARAEIQQLSGAYLLVELTSQASGNQVVLSWPKGALQTASSLVGPWTEVQGAMSPFASPVGASQAFYRVVSP